MKIQTKSFLIAGMIFLATSAIDSSELKHSNKNNELKTVK